METVQKMYKSFNENEYFLKFKKYIFANKTLIIIFFVFPFFFSILLKCIFETGIQDKFNDIFLTIKNISFETIISDFKMIVLLFSYMVSSLEYIIILAFELIFFGITGKLRKTYTILTIIFAIWASINRFVYQLRGTALVITDFLAINTAFNVMKGYKLEITWLYILSIVFTISFLILIYFIGKKELEIKNKYLKIISIIIGMLLCFGVINSKDFKDINLWNLENSYLNQGQVITMMKSIDNVIVEKPKNYSKEEAEKILSNYENFEKINTQELPNILVVMNESFADLKDTYNLDMEENLKFLKSLEENTISGTMYTPALGGKTASVEWEFLTGNSTAFIPYGATPYIQYISDKQESLVSILNDLDYETLAFHSYEASGYNRKIVYEKMLFKKSYFLDNMKNIDVISNDYPTDICTYENYFKFIENENQKKFGFIVTMQNHSPYTCPQEERVNYVGDNQLNQYLTLIKKSDEDLQKLIEKIKNSNEKTILVFFGDHQPAFITQRTDLFEEKEWMQNYQVPFIIWANYDIEERKEIEISTNYLSVLLSDIANIPKTSYLNFLSTIQEKIPIITANGYKGKDGIIYETQDINSPYYELINKYNILQYYQMFDKHETN